MNDAQNKKEVETSLVKKHVLKKNAFLICKMELENVEIRSSLLFDQVSLLFNGSNCDYLRHQVVGFHL